MPGSLELKLICGSTGIEASWHIGEHEFVPSRTEQVPDVRTATQLVTMLTAGSQSQNHGLFAYWASTGDSISAELCAFTNTLGHNVASGSAHLVYIDSSGNIRHFRSNTEVRRITVTVPEMRDVLMELVASDLSQHLLNLGGCTVSLISQLSPVTCCKVHFAPKETRN